MGNREADGEYEEGKENSEIEMSCSESSGGARLAYETLFNESPGRQYRSEEIHVEDEQKEDFIVSYFNLGDYGGLSCCFYGKIG